jgi:AhpD family alkylhydroperoxidase
MQESPIVVDATFVSHTAETAPAAAVAIIDGATAKFGYLPSPVAKMAASPQLLQAFLQSNALFEQTSLSALQREVVVMAVATRLQCHYCVAMHTALLHAQDAPEDEICSMRDRQPLRDPALEALRCFTLDAMDANGEVEPAALSRLLEAGYTPQTALDVVLGIGTYTLSIYANRLTRAPLDPAFELFRWDVPGEQ